MAWISRKALRKLTDDLVKAVVEAGIARQRLYIERSEGRILQGHYLELRIAAQVLLVLKDGPRDAAYRASKLQAWENLRTALQGDAECFPEVSATAPSDEVPQ